MINSVRNTVLSVLNKNNYGYITPADFNLYAKQAQMELYEEYYGNYNKLVTEENKRTSGTDYADIKKTYEEILDGFLVSSFLQGGTTINRFSIPSVTTTGYDFYMINKLLVGFNPITGINSAVQTFALVDTSVNFVSLGILPGDFVYSDDTFDFATVTQVFPSVIYLDNDIFPNPAVPYFIFKSSTINEAEKVTSAKITMLNNSSLTAPSTMFPAYTEIGPYFYVYPIIQNATSMNFPLVQATYFRYPMDPKWTYVTLTGGEPSFDQTQPDYQDFELPIEDEYKLAMKILQYCGISIRESEIVAFGFGQEQHEQPTFSQQQ